MTNDWLSRLEVEVEILGKQLGKLEVFRETKEFTEKSEKEQIDLNFEYAVQLTLYKIKKERYLKESMKTTLKGEKNNERN